MFWEVFVSACRIYGSARSHYGGRGGGGSGGASPKGKPQYVKLADSKPQYVKLSDSLTAAEMPPAPPSGRGGRSRGRRGRAGGRGGGDPCSWPSSAGTAPPPASILVMGDEMCFEAADGALSPVFSSPSPARLRQSRRRSQLPPQERESDSFDFAPQCQFAPQEKNLACIQCGRGAADCAMPGCGHDEQLCAGCHDQVARQREDDPSFDHVLSLMCRVCTRRPEGSLLGQR